MLKFKDGGDLSLRHKVKEKYLSNGCKKRKRGFTLVELLAVVVIISFVSGVGFVIYTNIIKGSKSKATALAIDTVKASAELYSKEENDNIKWMSFYDSDTGSVSGRYVCMTVKQLVNAGFFKENFFDNDIYKDSEIGNDTFFEIKQDANYANTEIIMHKEDTSHLMCEMSAINSKLAYLSISNEEKFTDRLSFDIGSNSDLGDVSYSCYLDDEMGEMNGSKCSFSNLVNNTVYDDVKVCATPDMGNDKITSTVCESFSLSTLDFVKPTISISNASEWKNSKTVTINYSNKNIYGDGYYYVKSEVNGTTNNSVYLCSGGTNDCNMETKNIEKDKWYRFIPSSNKYSLEVVVKENIGTLKKKVTAMVMDSTGNYLENTKTVTKIDSVAPSCVSSGGDTTWINKSSKQTKVTLVGTCQDNSDGSGCVKTTIKKDYTSDTNSTSESPGVVYDKAGNSTTCPGNQTVKIDKTNPTCAVSGGGSWTNQNVTVTGTCNDGNGSGCKGNVSATFTEEQNSSKSPGTIYDNAGNSTKCGNVKVMIDKTAPTCSSSGGSSSWTNKNITLTGTCKDAGSGCKGNVTKSYTSNTNSTSESPGTVYDKAGNSVTCPGNQTVKIDKTPPTCAVSGGGSWTNNNVTVTGTCSDTGGSGCKGNVSTTFTTEQNSSKSPGAIYDNAGNSTTCGTAWVAIDKTAPTVKVTMYKRKKKDDGTYTSTGSAICSATANNSDKGVTLSGCNTNLVNGWYNKANYPYGVYFKVSYSDTGGSDIKSKTWYYNGNGFAPGTDTNKYPDYSRTAKSTSGGTSHFLSGEGSKLARYSVTDNAGNTSYVNVNVKIDRTGPKIDAVHLKNFYLKSNCVTNNYNLQIQFKDPLSGNDYCSVNAACSGNYSKLTLENNAVDYENLARSSVCKGSKASVTAYDNAGNSSSATFTYPAASAHKSASSAWETYTGCSG